MKGITRVLWLSACLTLIGCDLRGPGPCPHGSRKLTFGYCKTCIFPRYGPAFGQILACSWEDALKELETTEPNSRRCNFSPAKSSEDCGSPNQSPTPSVTPSPSVSPTPTNTPCSDGTQPGQYEICGNCPGGRRSVWEFGCSYADARAKAIPTTFPQGSGCTIIMCPTPTATPAP